MFSPHRRLSDSLQARQEPLDPPVARRRHSPAPHPIEILLGLHPPPVLWPVPPYDECELLAHPFLAQLLKLANKGINVVLFGHAATYGGAQQGSSDAWPQLLPVLSFAIGHGPVGFGTDPSVGPSSLSRL